MSVFILPFIPHKLSYFTIWDKEQSGKKQNPHGSLWSAWLGWPVLHHLSLTVSLWNVLIIHKAAMMEQIINEYVCPHLLHVSY